MKARRLHRVVQAGSLAVAILLCAAFALAPVWPADVQPFRIETSRAEPKPLAALDLNAFRAPIWIAEPAALPPPAPPALPAPPPQTPLRFQLLAIVQEGAAYKAALYDPDLDRIVIVAAGENIGPAPRTIDSVTKSSVTFKDEAGLRTLALKEGSP